MANLANVHPGEVLLEEFLIPMDLSQYCLAQKIGVDQGRISEIIKGKRRITVETALRLSKFFGTTARFWLNLQNDYDLEETQQAMGEKLSDITPYQAVVRVDTADKVTEEPQDTEFVTA